MKVSRRTGVLGRLLVGSCILYVAIGREGPPAPAVLQTLPMLDVGGVEWGRFGSLIETRPNGAYEPANLVLGRKGGMQIYTFKGDYKEFTARLKRELIPEGWQVSAGFPATFALRRGDDRILVTPRRSLVTTWPGTPNANVYAIG